MNEPRCIRYFSSPKKANLARDLLLDNGFEAIVKEDKFGTVTLDKLGMPLRFRLYVERVEIGKIAKFLERKLRS